MTLKISFFALALCLPLNALATTTTEVWAKGVNRESGWFDFNKKDYFSDMGKCWAAAGSNVLAWWQKQYKVPTGTPQGEAVWETFRKAFTATPGSLPKYAIEWWLTGVYADAGKSDRAQLMEGVVAGGYYKSYFESEYKLASYLIESQDQDCTVMSKNIVRYLDLDYGISLSLRKDGQPYYGHEITLWGCEYDENGLITTMFVTDSDDEKDGLLELACYRKDTSTGRTRLGIRYDGREDIFVGNFDALAPADFLIPIPEPSALGLFAGLGALALVTSRRCRK